MEKFKDFMETHAKKFIIGAVLFVATLGIYGLVKLIRK